MSDAYRSEPVQVLVVEDGDEYITNLRTFVREGIDYTQARSGAEACKLARERSPDVVYLDMRFDRTPLEWLLGDLVALSSRFNGDTGRARQDRVAPNEEQRAIAIDGWGRWARRQVSYLTFLT